MSGRLVPVVKNGPRRAAARRAARAAGGKHRADRKPQQLVAGQAGKDLDTLDVATGAKPFTPKPGLRQMVTITPPPAAVNHATTPASAGRGLTRRQMAVGGGVLGAAGTGGYLVNQNMKHRRELAGMSKGFSLTTRAAFGDKAQGTLMRLQQKQSQVNQGMKAKAPGATEPRLNQLRSASARAEGLAQRARHRKNYPDSKNLQGFPRRPLP